MGDILGFNFEQSRKKFIASNEICRKCLRNVCDLVRKEEEVKATKEDLVTSFFSTTSKFNKNQMALGMAEDATCPEYQHPFHQKPLPLPMTFLNQAKPGYFPPTSLVQFYRPGWKTDLSLQQDGQRHQQRRCLIILPLRFSPSGRAEGRLPTRDRLN